MIYLLCNEVVGCETTFFPDSLGNKLWVLGSGYNVVPSDQCIADVLSQAGVRAIMDQAASEVNSMFKASKWLREDAFQDAVYLLFLQKK